MPRPQKARKKSKGVFGDRITEPKIVDVVEYPQYRAFRLEFMLFNYDRGFIGFTISIGDRFSCFFEQGNKPTFIVNQRLGQILEELMIESLAFKTSF